MPQPTSQDVCFDSVNTVLVDGANGVCRRPAPRTDSLGASSAAVFAVVFVACTLFFTRRRMPRAPFALLTLVAVLAVSLPGLIAVWFRRADAPAHLSETAHALDQFNAQVGRFAAAHGGCIEVVQRGCVACPPVLRYLRPLHACRAPRGRVVVGLHSLSTGCSERGDVLTCGEAR